MKAGSQRRRAGGLEPTPAPFGLRRREMLQRLIAATACMPPRLSADPSATTGPDPIPFRFVLTRSTLGDIGHHDAVAAVKAWVSALVQDFPLPVKVEVFILPDAHEIPALIADEKLEGVTVSAEDYLSLGMQPQHIYVLHRNGSPRIRYLLLAREDSGSTLEGTLRKGGISMPRSAVTALASAWFQGLCRETGIEGALPAIRFAEVSNASKAILRVYFRQAEACLTSESALAIAREMNPQLGGALKVLAASPEIIPSAFFLRDGVRRDLREEIEKKFFSPAAPSRMKQVLTVFQGDLIARVPKTEWDATLDVLRQWKGVAAAPGRESTAALVAGAVASQDAVPVASPTPKVSP
ncbi:MAG: PhnD/SsuA/transferrin family substrate-binding protein [Verrucomicrobiales bacterium]|nr:PhnD/SsuA/transferrin family substrate-binding protein [Verrucomicrobiales bacterium]